MRYDDTGAARPSGGAVSRQRMWFLTVVHTQCRILFRAAVLTDVRIMREKKNRPKKTLARIHTRCRARIQCCAHHSKECKFRPAACFIYAREIKCLAA